MEKSSYQKTSFALAKRILLLFFFLVFIPLLILTALLFREEYVFKRNEKKIMLASMMDNHQDIVQEEVKREKQFLQSLFFVDPKYWHKSNFLKKWASERKVVEIFHIGKAYYGNYVCDKSSLPQRVGQERTFFQVAMKGKHFAALMSPDKKEITFLQRDMKGGIWAETYLFDAWALFFKPICNSPLQYEVFISFDKGVMLAKNKLRSSHFEHVERSGKMYDVAAQAFKFMPFEVCYFLPKSFGIGQIPEFYNKLSIIVVIMFCIGALLSFFILPQFTKPFRQLFIKMQKAGSGHLEVRFQRRRFGFELNTIGESFNDMMENLDYHIKREQKQRASKESLKKELELGRAVQKSMLGENPPQSDAYAAKVFFRSAKEVGGDFFDFFKINDDKMMFLVADTSGKGLDACLFALTIRSILRSFAKSLLPLEALVKQANDVYLQDSSKSQMFITAWVGIFDTKSKMLEYCNLGHNPPMFIRSNKQIQTLEPTGISLGVDSYSGVVSEKIKVKQGDKLLLYTDGISEAMDKEGKQFGVKTLTKLFDENRGASPDQLVKLIMKQVIGFCGKAPISDDQTLIALEFLL